MTPASSPTTSPPGVALYRKKPIPLEARQVCSVHGREVAQWCGSRYDDVLHRIIVHTLEGPLPAWSGDWIVKGTRGEFWPVRADVFAETYEPAQAADGVSTWTVSRLSLIGALRESLLGAALSAEGLGELADAILGQLPAGESR